jgi:dephospho-CoA kinase
MIKIGITGGIASGKTTASDFFKEKGAYVFNADKEAKKHLKNSLVLQKKIISIFGNDIVEDNKINFNKLADIAFKNKTNHNILNGIMWPELFLLINEEYNTIKNQSNYNFFVVDAALIFEANFTSFFDYIILITASKNIRLNRAVKRTNISLENIQNRISLQMPEKDKKKLTDFVINNSYSTKNLKIKLEELYSNLF